MKLLFASDLHGSAYYAQKLEELIRTETPDKTILLGDLLYHGPRNDLPREYDPKRVTAILNGLKTQVLAVRGNCDAEVDQMVLTFPVLADYAVLPVGQRLVYVTRGLKQPTRKLQPGRPQALSYLVLLRAGFS